MLDYVDLPYLCLREGQLRALHVSQMLLLVISNWLLLIIPMVLILATITVAPWSSSSNTDRCPLDQSDNANPGTLPCSLKSNPWVHGDLLILCAQNFHNFFPSINLVIILGTRGLASSVLRNDFMLSL